MTGLCRHRAEAEAQLQPIRTLSTRRMWVVNTTFRPLYPRETPRKNCTGRWVGLRTALDVTENLVYTGMGSPVRRAPSKSLYRSS
jgi:hypothetical protein